MITKRVETVLVQHYGHKELERRRVISEILRRFDGWQKVADLPAGTAAMAENVKRAPSQNTSRTNSPRFPPVLLGGNMICSHPRSGREGSALGNEHAFPAPFMVLPQRIELWTSPLPRGCASKRIYLALLIFSPSAVGLGADLVLHAVSPALIDGASCATLMWA